MRLVKISELAVGQTIAADVSNLHQRVILRAGAVVDAQQCAMLRAWGIQEVAVEGEAGPEPPVSQGTENAESREAILAPADQHDRSHPAFRELVEVVARVKPRLGGMAMDPILPLPPQTGPAASVPSKSLSAETISASARLLPSLPSVYFQVDRVINHPASSAADIAAVLSGDQGICARLLCIANSAFYGFSRRIDTVSEAVRVIGTGQLRDLVLATVVLMQFKGVHTRLVSMTSFWRHSLASGIAARSIAAARRETNPERYFVAGLLHDIGSLLLYQAEPALAQAAIERHRATDLSLEATERALIGCHHGSVGAALMAKWKLPHFFQEVAASHHAADACTLTPPSAVIWLADLLVMALQLGTNGEARPSRFDPRVWELIGIDASALQQIADEVVRLLGETQRAFLGDELAA
jgi:putative nucleotidyltransferase with HDIG domain